MENYLNCELDAFGCEKDCSVCKHNKKPETFVLLCPKCGNKGNTVSHRRKSKNKLVSRYICPYCGYGEEQQSHLYE